MQKEELHQLIEGCKRGERVSQRKIYEFFYSKMLGVCMRYSPDFESAKDIFQEAFIKVFQYIEDYDYKGAFEGWVRRIIVNHAIDTIRKTKIDYTLSDTDELLDFLAANEDVEEEVMESIYSTSDIMDAIQELSPGYRAVFNMYVLEGYTHQEIAEYLEINIGTSKSNLAKAKQNIRKILETKKKQKHARVGQL